jgi:addiction module HigA family antidote
MVMHRQLLPIHPGEILQEEFLKPLGITQYRLAKDIKVSPRRINEIIHGNRSITADTALRLAQYFNTSAQFWMHLQTHYDLSVQEDTIGEEIVQNIQTFSLLKLA